MAVSVPICRSTLSMRIISSTRVRRRASPTRGFVSLGDLAVSGIRCGARRHQRRAPQYVTRGRVMPQSQCRRYTRQRPERRSVWRQCGRNQSGRTKNCEGTGAERGALGLPRGAAGPIRELLPTLPPAVALGHQEPVRHALKLMRQKQLSCVLVVAHGQLVGCSPSAMWSPKWPPCRSMWTTCRCRRSCSRIRSACIWTMHSSMPSTRCTTVPTGMSPSWMSSGGPPPWC